MAKLYTIKQIVRDCVMCPNCEYPMRCKLNGRYIGMGSNRIPEWCPLPDWGSADETKNDITVTKPQGGSDGH